MDGMDAPARGTSPAVAIPASLAGGRCPRRRWAKLVGMHAALKPLHHWRAVAARHPRRTDAALTVLVVALTLAPLVGARPMPVWGWPLVGAECLPLLWWRARPFPAGLA